jgi:hypothetical protein
MPLMTDAASCSPCRTIRPRHTAVTSARVGIGVGVVCLVVSTGCVSTGSVHASLGQRGIEVSPIQAPASASATGGGTIETFSVRLANAGALD